MKNRSPQYLIRVRDELKKFKVLPARGPYGGVCSGLAYWTGMPAWIFRLTFLLTSLWFGFGLSVYLVLWLLVPEGTVTDDEFMRRTGQKS